jgi:hypothetical protein
VSESEEAGILDVCDELGTWVDDCYGLEDAITVCDELAERSVHERLLEAIQEADIDGIDIASLFHAARLLGVDTRAFA